MASSQNSVHTPANDREHALKIPGHDSLDLESGYKSPVHQQSTFTFKGISAEVKAKGNPRKEILHDVNGSVRSGELLALMGPSGCGKTTLLNILARRGNRIEIAGDITFNGEKPSAAKFRALSSYVEQEDSLIGKSHIYSHSYTVSRRNM